MKSGLTLLRRRVAKKSVWRDNGYLEAKTIFLKAQVLAEVEDIIKTMPPRATIRHDTSENHSWFGRASAVIEKWNPSKIGLVKEYLDLFFSNGHARQTGHGLTKLLTLLNQAQAELRLDLAGAQSTKISESMSANTMSGAAVATEGRGGGLEAASRPTIRIFISHSHADAAIAETFAELFQSAFNLTCNAIRCSSVPRYHCNLASTFPGKSGIRFCWLPW